MRVEKLDGLAVRAIPAMGPLCERSKACSCPCVAEEMALNPRCSLMLPTTLGSWLKLVGEVANHSQEHPTWEV